MRALFMAAAGAVLVAPMPSLAQQAPTRAPVTAQGDVSVTIYNGGRALVQDMRTLDISGGISRIEFPDVSAQIQPQTVAFAADGVTLQEQNFDFDLLSPEALMRAAVGEDITLIRTNPSTGAEVRERARVLAVNQGVVVQIGERIEILRDDGLPVRAVFDTVPPGLRARPTLSVTLNARRGGRRPATLRYLTGGLGWQADYVAMFDQARGTIDVQGWITLTNNSGTTYHNARTLLVAGNVNGGGGSERGNMRQVGTETANREMLGDVYLYPLQERTTIATAQTKQVGFLEVAGVPAERIYEHDVSMWQNDPAPRAVRTVIAFSTSANGGLGDALPAGTVRFYMRDASGAPQFIGENAIGHTPMGSRLALTTGSAFNVQVQSELIRRERITEAQWVETSRSRVSIPGQPPATINTQTLQRRDYWRSTMRYRLTNARPEPSTVQLTQNDLNWWWDSTRVLSETQEGEVVGPSSRRWRVTVPANGSVDLEVVYATRY
jgi:hypothetical protein